MNEEPKPNFSNVRSGSSSTAPAALPQADGDASPGASAGTYVVREGDSLSKIAERTYGDGTKWSRIYEANRDLIKDPDLISPGQLLQIPE